MNIQQNKFLRTNAPIPHFTQLHQPVNNSLTPTKIQHSKNKNRSVSVNKYTSQHPHKSSVNYTNNFTKLGFLTDKSDINFKQKTTQKTHKLQKMETKTYNQMTTDLLKESKLLIHKSLEAIQPILNTQPVINSDITNAPHDKNKYYTMQPSSNGGRSPLVDNKKRQGQGKYSGQEYEVKRKELLRKKQPKNPKTQFVNIVRGPLKTDPKSTQLNFTYRIKQFKKVVTQLIPPKHLQARIKPTGGVRGTLSVMQGRLEGIGNKLSKMQRLGVKQIAVGRDREFLKQKAGTPRSIPSSQSLVSQNPRLKRTKSLTKNQNFAQNSYLKPPTLPNPNKLSQNSLHPPSINQHSSKASMHQSQHHPNNMLTNGSMGNTLKTINFTDLQMSPQSSRIDQIYQSSRQKTQEYLKKYMKLDPTPSKKKLYQNLTNAMSIKTPTQPKVNLSKLGTYIDPYTKNKNTTITNKPIFESTNTNNNLFLKKFIVPQRSSQNSRLYTEQEIQKLFYSGGKKVGQYRFQSVNLAKQRQFMPQNIIKEIEYQNFVRSAQKEAYTNRDQGNGDKKRDEKQSRINKIFKKPLVFPVQNKSFLNNLIPSPIRVRSPVTNPLILLPQNYSPPKIHYSPTRVQRKSYLLNVQKIPPILIYPSKIHCSPPPRRRISPLLVKKQYLNVQTFSPVRISPKKLPVLPVLPMVPVVRSISPVLLFSPIVAANKRIQNQNQSRIKNSQYQQYLKNLQTQEEQRTAEFVGYMPLHTFEQKLKRLLRKNGFREKVLKLIEHEQTQEQRVLGKSYSNYSPPSVSNPLSPITNQSLTFRKKYQSKVKQETYNEEDATSPRFNAFSPKKSQKTEIFLRKKASNKKIQQIVMESKIKPKKAPFSKRIDTFDDIKEKIDVNKKSPRQKMVSSPDSFRRPIKQIIKEDELLKNIKGSGLKKTMGSIQSGTGKRTNLKQRNISDTNTLFNLPTDSIQQSFVQFSPTTGISYKPQEWNNQLHLLNKTDQPVRQFLTEENGTNGSTILTRRELREQKNNVETRGLNEKELTHIRKSIKSSLIRLQHDPKKKQRKSPKTKVEIQLNKKRRPFQKSFKDILAETRNQRRQSTQRGDEEPERHPSKSGNQQKILKLQSILEKQFLSGGSNSRIQQQTPKGKNLMGVVMGQNSPSSLRDTRRANSKLDFNLDFQLQTFRKKRSILKDFHPKTRRKEGLFQQSFLKGFKGLDTISKQASERSKSSSKRVFTNKTFSKRSMSNSKRKIRNFDRRKHFLDTLPNFQDIKSSMSLTKLPKRASRRQIYENNRFSNLVKDVQSKKGSFTKYKKRQKYTKGIKFSLKKYLR